MESICVADYQFRLSKSVLFLLAVLLIVPAIVSADNIEFGTQCNEVLVVGASDDPDQIRGTCKEIQAYTEVSLDPAIRKDYFLGTHMPLQDDCTWRGGRDEVGCDEWGPTKYSEGLFITSSTTLMERTVGVENPLKYAVFEKTYFVPLLSKLFKEAGFFYSEESMLNLRILLLKKSEIDEIQQKEGNWLSPYELTKWDVVYRTENYDSARYSLNSLNYQAYGKYIYAPKNILAESQYADFDAGNMLDNTDLQIAFVNGGSTAVVPITSPLTSVTNYWLYTKKAGKITLSWEKSEYVLDNGNVKVLTGTEKNISAAFLFGDSFPATYKKTDLPSQTTKSIDASDEQKKGFFSRLLDVILSWFR